LEEEEGKPLQEAKIRNAGSDAKLAINLTAGVGLGVNSQTPLKWSFEIYFTTPMLGCQYRAENKAVNADITSSSTHGAYRHEYKLEEEEKPSP
jgi:hypothetical protein